MDLYLLRDNPFFLDNEAVSWVHETRESLSLKEKIGQIFIPICVGHDEDNLKRILRYRPGGVHRFLGEDAKTLRATADFLQKNASIPLLMTTDFEFNSFNSLPEGTHLPTQLGVAATGHTAMAKRMGSVAGREGRYCGFNCSFTPSVDISYNFQNPVVGNLSFGENPDTVAAMATEYIRGMQAEGMAACAKHWPGDGVDDRDQHLVTTRNSMDMKRWRDTYGKVYGAAIGAGVKTVMSAHITLPACYREKDPSITADKILPASISRELNLELLRGELGFNGVIISDATSMAGLTSVGRREDIVPLVIEGGCDVFLFSMDDDMDLALLMKGAESGLLSRERLDDAVTRVLALKASLGLHRQQKKKRFLPPESQKKSHFRTKTFAALESEMAEKSITLVKDTQKLLPLSPERHQRILFIHGMKDDDIGSAPPLILPDLLEDEGFEVSEYREDTFVDPDIFDVVLYLAARQSGFCKGNYRIDWNDLQWGQARAMNRYWHLIPTVFISMGNPYHLYEVPRCKTYINAYSPIEPVQRALVAALTGKIPFVGRNPVDPFCGLEEARL
jgi:beta-N-acetylhexosaminidase